MEIIENYLKDKKLKFINNVEDGNYTIFIGSAELHLQIEDEETFQSWLIIGDNGRFNEPDFETELYTDTEFNGYDSTNDWNREDMLVEFLEASIAKANDFITLEAKVSAKISEIERIIENSGLELSYNDEITFGNLITNY